MSNVLFFSNHNGDWVKFPSDKFEKDGETRYKSNIKLLDEDYEERMKDIANAVRSEYEAQKVNQKTEAVEF